MNSFGLSKPRRSLFFSIFEMNLELECRSQCTKTKTDLINTYEADLPPESLEDDLNGSLLFAKKILCQSGYLPNNVVFGLSSSFDHLEPCKVLVEARLLGFKQTYEIDFCGIIHEMRVIQGAHESIWGYRFRRKNQIIELTVVKNMLTGTVRFRVALQTSQQDRFAFLQKYLARATLATMQQLVQAQKGFSQTSA